MPLFEFYCQSCHTIYTFRSQCTRGGEAPLCPHCKGELKREISLFSHSVGGHNNADMHDDDESCDRIERVMADMGERMQALEDDDGDPREAVSVLRAMADASGVRFKPDVLEAMARIDAGEDPDKIDDMFGEVFETENPFDEVDQEGRAQGMEWRKRSRAPRRDPDWYDWPAE